MRCVFTLDDAREGANSIFLAGPTPLLENQKTTRSWRFDVLRLLNEFGFDGDVFIPEIQDGEYSSDWTYSKQVDWEIKMLTKATAILFWIPRDLVLLPGFTTNIEFGEWLKSGKIVVGAPEGAPKMQYLQERCSRLKIPWQDTMENCVRAAINKVHEINGNLSKVWFTADTHFGQQRTLELSRRPFRTADEMSWTIVTRWNANVSDNDIVYHLGDFGNPTYVGHLRGKTIYLLPGNYDNQDVLDTLQRDPRIQLLPDNHFLPEIGCRLTHAPEMANDSSGNDFFLFGHIHQLQMIKRNGLNVGADCHDFKPIDTETVGFYRKAIEKHYDINVFMDVLGKK